jgi:hypothetical protein
MNSDQTILLEIKDISPAVANLPKTNPYSVPLDYFENNISTIISLIKGKDLTHQNVTVNFNLSIEKNETVFDLPKDYFETFGIQLMNKIHTIQTVDDELKEMAPGLISLRTKNPFTIPKGYFNTAVIEEPLRKNNLVRVFQMKNLLRYAAAACIIGLIGLSYILTKVDGSGPVVSSTANNQWPAELSLDDMVIYLQQMDEIGHDSDLEFSNGGESNLLVDLTQETIQEMLNGIPDKGINEFIEDEGIMLEKTNN